MRTQKKIIALFLCFLLSVSVCGCGLEIQREGDQGRTSSMFIEIESSGPWRVVYHRDTKVMYAVSNGLYSSGIFTMLVNSDGTPMLWED